MTVHLVGVGPGPADLLTVRATRLIARCGTCLYDGEIPREVLALCPALSRSVDTTGVPAEDVHAEIRSAHQRGDLVVVLFPGDPASHPARDELTRALTADEIPWDLVPGVSGVPGVAHGVPGFPGAAPELPTTGPEATSAGRPTAVAPPAPPQPPAPLATASRPARASMPTAEPGRILVLGGTGEARRLADLMVTAGLDVVTALAGKVARPRLPRGQVRTGGFGGAEGLAHWLRQHDVSVVIDATDPFATEISASAIRAVAETGAPLLRVHRPPWSPEEGDDWIRVPDMTSAARVVEGRFRRPMLTVGKQGPAAFAGDTGGSYLIRCAEPPTGPLPHRYLLMLGRGPFTDESERAIMSRHRIDALVSRNSGGEASAAKLRAARDLRIPVVMVDRPAGSGDAPRSADTLYSVDTLRSDEILHSESLHSVDTVYSVDDAARWLVERFGSR
ncbi:cobalt-precorrin-6A reductase [Rhodococcus sp. IEGM 1408]|uniref:cobalt-precorrin-6A reductase n=1 Tax=Rhodococcus sp. IEGM 1408 TaxID=3082220 RepID=UPI002952B269|nr:cobalt-precorrin-6A reductase [Rhodococcus sp. IEGM 1408]MDV8000191.1 cobalt-precorrin-6A reductase [Rhodococcus sp. IEGM 1408]